MTFRPAATLFTLALAGCTGSLSSAPSSVPTEATDAPEPAGPVLHSPSSPAQLAALPWRSAWPAGEGVVADTDAAGRLLTPEESVAVSPGAQCGSLHHFPAQGKLWVPAGDPIAYEKAPAVSAALVERSAWRLAEVGPESKAVLPGVQAPDPAIHLGVRVRSVRKVRRQGPPYQLVLGERNDQVLIALTDTDASTRLDGLALQRSGRDPVLLGIVPAHDLDGDDHPEVVVYGDGEQGSLRAVISIDLLRGTLELRSFEGHDPVRCD